MWHKMYVNHPIRSILIDKYINMFIFDTYFIRSLQES